MLTARTLDGLLLTAQKQARLDVVEFIRQFEGGRAPDPDLELNPEEQVALEEMLAGVNNGEEIQGQSGR